MMNDPELLKLKRNLTALAEFSRIINSSLDLNFIINNILLSCMGKFHATRGFVAIRDNGHLKLHSSKGIPDSIIKNIPDIPAGEKIDEDNAFRSFIQTANIVAVKQIRLSNKCLGVLCLGEKMNNNPYTEDDLEFLGTILNISSTAIQNSIMINELKIVNRELDSRIQRLNSLFELSKEFGLFTETTRVTKLLVYSVIGQFLVSKFAVLTFENGNIQILESKFDNSSLLKFLGNYDAAKINISLRKEEVEKHFPDLLKLEIEVVVPMQLQGKTRGLILLGKRINQLDYTEADIEFIYSVGSLAIVSLENRRLFKEALEKQKMEEELDIARDIQQNLLPRRIPKINGFDIAATNVSSKQVGGDYYDIIRLDEENFCFAIADVSGKGVPAALVMANLQAFIKTTCLQGMKIDEATALINNLISENITDGKFITFFWGVISISDKTLRYVNAGHNPPLLIRNNQIIKLNVGGIILGVMKTVIPYQTEVLQLQKDDLIVLFTDGVSEALNTAGDEYSDERLEALVLKNSDRSSSEILELIRSDVQEFSSGTVQSDDITLVVVKVD